jgi:hypothetical protein
MSNQRAMAILAAAVQVDICTGIGSIQIVLLHLPGGSHDDAQRARRIPIDATRFDSKATTK